MIYNYFSFTNQGGFAIQFLVEQNGSIEAKDNEGFTPIDYAASLYNFKFLIKLGSKLKSVNETLLFAARENNEEVFQHLVEKYNANIEFKNDQGETALHLAAKNSTDVGVVQYLLIKKVDVNSVDNEGKTPAFNVGLQFDGDVLLDVLNERKADFFVKDNSGMTVLHHASNYGRPDMAKYLIEKGLEVNDKTNNGLTPLHFVSRNKTADSCILIKQLVKSKADIEARDESGQTPLHLASKNGALMNVKLLIERNADVGSFDFEGLTPLKLATINNHQDVVEFLKNLVA